MILRDVYFCLYMFMFIIPDLCEFTPLYLQISYLSEVCNIQIYDYPRPKRS